MSVGSQGGKATVDAALTDLTVAWTNLAQQASRLNAWVNGQGEGLAYLVSLGYDNTTPNANNPGSLTDAAWALQVVNYLATLEGVFAGTAAQPAVFNFANAFAPLCAGQLS